MKRHAVVWLGVVALAMLGCSETHEVDSHRNEVNSELVKSLQQRQIENAVITQHTLFPYHFETDGAQLNELGKRDLEILAEHFSDRAGVLNVRKSDTPNSLYEERVALVLKGLKDAGVNVDRIQIQDGMAGGSGVSSERVLVILQNEADRSESPSDASTSTTMISGQGSR